MLINVVLLFISLSKINVLYMLCPSAKYQAMSSMKMMPTLTNDKLQHYHNLRKVVFKMRNSSDNHIRSAAQFLSSGCALLCALMHLLFL